MKQSTTISRRTILKSSAAASAAFSMPYFFSRASAQSTLQFWQFYAPGGEVATQSTWFEDLVQSWNDQNETQIELVYIPSADYISGSTLSTAFASGEGPDIFIISPGDFLRYYNGGVLQDLTPFMEQEAIDDFYPDVIATRSVDDKIYGLPMEVEPLAMYYDVQAWEDAGLGEGDIPTTWDDLLGVADTLTNDERFGVLFDTTPGYYQNFTWYPFLWMGGAEIVNDDGVTSGINSDAGIQALQFWKDTIERGIAPRDILGTGGGDPVANLASGYTAIQNTGIWAISELRENAPDFEYDVFKLPVPPEGTYTTDLGGWAFVANAQGADPETAAQFCVWALGSMSDESIQRGVEWCTEAKSDLGPRASVMDLATENGAFDSGAMQRFSEDIFPGGRAEPRVPPEVYKPISDAIQACQLGGEDAEQAAHTAAEQIDSFLAGYDGAPIL